MKKQENKREDYGTANKCTSEEQKHLQHSSGAVFEEDEREIVACVQSDGLWRDDIHPRRSDSNETGNDPDSLITCVFNETGALGDRRRKQKEEALREGSGEKGKGSMLMCLRGSRKDLSNSSSTLFLFSSSSLIEIEFQVKTDEKNKTTRHRSEKEIEEKHNVAQLFFSFP